MTTEKKLRDYARAVVSAARLRDDAVLPSDFPDLTDPQFERLCDIVAAYPVPDLPVPDHAGYWWPEHDFVYSHVQSHKFTGTRSIIIARGASSLFLTRTEALELASILTAAATEEA